jgi:hypothetical protein
MSWTASSFPSNPQMLPFFCALVGALASVWGGLWHSLQKRVKSELPVDEEFVGFFEKERLELAIDRRLHPHSILRKALAVIGIVMIVLFAFLIYSVGATIDPWLPIYGLCLLATFLIQAKILRGIFVRLKKAGIPARAYKSTFGVLRADKKLYPERRDRSVFLSLMALEVTSLVFFAVLVVRSTLTLR